MMVNAGLGDLEGHDFFGHDPFGHDPFGHSRFQCALCDINGESDSTFKLSDV